MPTTDEILAAIPSTEPCTFGEFCGELTDCPERGDKPAWAELFADLKALERGGLIEVERANRGGAIEGLLLTAEGAERVRRTQAKERLNQ